MSIKPVLYSTLKNINLEPRDQFIQFLEENHKYIITCDTESSYTSVTTWNHSHFPHFNAEQTIEKMMGGKSWKPGHKYWGKTMEQIKDEWNLNKNNVSIAGTNMHYRIECFMNNPNISKTIYNHSNLLNEYLEQSFSEMEDLKEWSYFLNFIQDNPDFVPYRTEWTIFHEDLKLAGSIDMVYKNEDGTLNIYDWKRAKNITPVNYFNKFAVTEIISHFPDSNFWHYALQLNTYQAILEDKYNKKVKDLYLVRLHPDAEEENYELIKIPNLQKEIKELWAERKKTFIIKKT